MILFNYLGFLMSVLEMAFALSSIATVCALSVMAWLCAYRYCDMISEHKFDIYLLDAWVFFKVTAAIMAGSLLFFFLLYGLTKI